MMTLARLSLGGQAAEAIRAAVQVLALQWRHRGPLHHHRRVLVHGDARPPLHVRVPPSPPSHLPGSSGGGIHRSLHRVFSLTCLVQSGRATRSLVCLSCTPLCRAGQRGGQAGAHRADPGWYTVLYANAGDLACPCIHADEARLMPSSVLSARATCAIGHRTLLRVKGA